MRACLLLVFALQIQASDDAWHRGTREAVDAFLLKATPQKRLELTLLPVGDPPPTANGEYVFGYGGQGHEDAALPNPAFFQHLDWVLKRAQGKGFVVGVLPVDPGSQVGKNNSRQKWFEWGRYLGRRYMKAKSLVWLKPDDAGPLEAIYEGIRQFDSVHPIEASGRHR